MTSRIQKKLSIEKTGIVRIKSVLSRTAQTSSMCTPGIMAKREFFSNANDFFNKSNEVLPLKAILWLMYQEGLRVSEVVNIPSINVLRNGSILIKGLKGSNDRVVTPGRYQSFWNDFSLSGGSISDFADRYYLYRVCKKHGLYFSHSGSHKKSVTHSFRHALINELNQQNISLAAIKNHIGHKSERSTKFYIHE